MAGRNFHKNRLKLRRKDLINKSIFIREKKFIEAHYDFLECTIKKKELTCLGYYKPTENSKMYKFKITYDGKYSPDIHVIEPKIKYNDDIHMYPKRESLCLYHAETDNFYWNPKKHNIFDTIIPWTLEWFLYYELYLITGKWEHPFKEHRHLKNK